jgi:hypothetical protein
MWQIFFRILLIYQILKLSFDPAETLLFCTCKQTMLRCRNAILYLSLIDRNKFRQEGVGSLLGFFIGACQKLSQDFSMAFAVAQLRSELPNQTKAEFVAIEIIMMRGKM